MIKIQENILLKEHSTFKIGGAAKYFTLANNESQLIEALKWSRNKNIPFLILGNGSKILFSDKGYQGLVIKIQISNIQIQGEKIICGAGVLINKILGLVTAKGLTGLEWAAGIPGTIGGAIFGNAGAFGFETKDIVENVKVLNLKDFKITEFQNEKCQFSYRSSIFKERKNYIILQTELRLRQSEGEDVRKKIKENLLYRKGKHPLEYPSVGSIFQNVKLSKENQKLIEKFPDLKQFSQGGEIPTAHLINSCQLKGKTIGGAQISEKHPNFIINIGEAKAQDVISLIKLIKKKIKEKFGINLKEEIIII